MNGCEMTKKYILRFLSIIAGIIAQPTFFIGILAPLSVNTIMLAAGYNFHDEKLIDVINILRDNEYACALFDFKLQIYSFITALILGIFSFSGVILDWLKNDTVANAIEKFKNDLLAMSSFFLIVGLVAVLVYMIAGGLVSDNLVLMYKETCSVSSKPPPIQSPVTWLRFGISLLGILQYFFLKSLENDNA